MFKLMDKKIITILRGNILLNWPYETAYKACSMPFKEHVSLLSWIWYYYKSANEWIIEFIN